VLTTHRLKPVALESAESRMKIKMSCICRELAQIPESRRALPLLLMFSASLMGAFLINKFIEIYVSMIRPPSLENSGN
jgi:hypothetical protein